MVTVYGFSRQEIIHPGQIPEVSLEGWMPVQLKLSKDQMPADWSGLGWFIAKLRIDTALFGKEMAIHGNCHGAMELYLNGVQIGTAGQVGTNVSQEIGAGYLSPVTFRFSAKRVTVFGDPLFKPYRQKILEQVPFWHNTIDWLSGTNL